MSSSKTALTLLAGVVIGGAMGFAAGMLLAPDKGSETRKRVKKSIDEITEDFVEKMDEVVNQFGDLVDDAEEVVEKKFAKEKDKA
ncbi:MAG: YtxH domain-containing protein [Bacteroidetes bacterium]|nr:MAG: YtxH domain-containing protein [Bacteroidota bacterium]